MMDLQGDTPQVIQLSVFPCTICGLPADHPTHSVRGDHHHTVTWIENPVRKLIAAAWDEGYEAGMEDANYISGGIFQDLAINPYRANANDEH